jgi:hypothetical protein
MKIRHLLSLTFVLAKGNSGPSARSQLRKVYINVVFALGCSVFSLEARKNQRRSSHLTFNFGFVAAVDLEVDAWSELVAVVNLEVDARCELVKAVDLQVDARCELVVV